MLSQGNLKHILGYGLALLSIMLFLSFWIKERETRIRGEAQISARDEAQAKMSTELDRRIATLTSQTAKTVLRPIVLPRIPVSQELPNEGFKEVEVKDLPTELQKTLPEAPETKMTLLSPDQMVDLGKRELSCQKSIGELTVCKQDKKDLQNIVDGGSKWHKLVQEAKCLGFLGGGAALGAKIAGWKGAAVGGVAGEVSCKIFF